ncbi:hypothetical protein EHQ94_06930 [Leptospira meyeri]|uniref:SMI1/KNR4 family protein n=1 Tax=Leptospira meyeri TaxID=29508 RepID=UPI001084313A|nr:SMI1/KNR4 family protein [Leptospira meyeri]TGM71714.1 hypothetical protein EHQ94_06930 [Leptospira meyeri]
MKYEEILSFNFKLLDTDDSLEFSRKFYSDLGLKNYSTYWALLDINSEKFNDFYLLAKKYLKDKKANFYGYCTLNQTYLGKGEDDWYELDTPIHISDFISPSNISNLYPEGKIYKFPEDTNVVDSIYYTLFFSKKITEFILDKKYSGIDFLWLKDNGKYKANEWYIPVADKPIGKGLDHDWYDANSLLNSKKNPFTSSEYRAGVNIFTNNEIKKKYKFQNDIYSSLLELFETSELYIISARRYLKQYLPNSDFAYGWNLHHDTERRRTLFIKRNVASALLNEKLIKKENLLPLEILDLPPNGTINLDFEAKFPPPLYLKNEFEKLKEYSQKSYLNHKKNVKPILTIKLDQSLKKIKKYIKESDENHPKGLKNLDLNIPSPIIEMLKISNGPELNPEVIFLSDKELPDFNNQIKRELEDNNQFHNESKFLFHFAKSINGDWYSINLNEKSSECNFILRFSHEEMTPIEKWKSFAEFLNDIANGCYD